MNMLSGSDLTHKSLRITTHHHLKEYKLSKRLMINTRSDRRSDHDRDHHNHDYDHDHQDHYHGGSSVSIPFTWESQPGTPKVVKFRETSLPPLTPPPSYCYSPVTKRPSQSNHRSGKTGNLVMKAIFPKKKRSSNSTLSLSPSSSSSASDYSPDLASKPRGSRRRSISSPRVSVDSISRVYVGGDERGSPDSTLCFGRSGVNARSRSGCYSSFIKVLLS